MPSLPPQASGPQPPRTTRRDFIRWSGRTLGLLALGRFACNPSLLLAQGTDGAAFPRRILVLVQLVGGNDGLNTVIPFTDDNYHRLRPTLAVPVSQVLPISDQLGLHPACAGMHELIRSGKMTVVQNVGYPRPSRSHFRAAEIWAGGRTTRGLPATGWLGRYLDFAADDLGGNATVSEGAHLTEEFPLCLLQPSPESASFNLRRPGEVFADSLQRVAAHIAARSPTQVYVLSLGGFDTHSHQANAHAHVLSVLSRGLAAFQEALAMRGLEERVLTMTVSEFGRRALENESCGTDHGTAAPMFLMGPGIARPLIGTPPQLEAARHEDLVYCTDFRQVYATVLEDWLGCSAEPVLDLAFDKLPLFGGTPTAVVA